ncbi:hypothetical protein BAG01nite_05950 [Brevibacillus agri]|uniref:Butirosin biosynthesis protein H N-terminal domain-containing protein n=1 Tax=Brevibacillus agri TaxID=51101 RepID=A0A3M8BC41_9BACL|nr:hypothetical protein [Brevibacillus agri]QAV13969.1 hypothetical protein BA6348_15070 [Brevibacillus agri]RNB60842.1 hypothetical protein EB820_01550 [Brevibacillus agri]GED24493.1 hypothetical protein BAG01nite_05950 [Brevibacillus agri]
MLDAFSLPAEPFNGTWVNCVSNNLISILMNRDKSFAYAPCMAQAQFHLHVVEADDGQEAAAAHEEGVLLLDVARGLDFSSVLDFQTRSLQANDSVHVAIKELLRSGYYVFVDLDRFHYPSGVDAEKQHQIHPAFLYGYDEHARSYLLIEDCLQPSKMEPYALPYDCFERALAAAQTSSLLVTRIKAQEEAAFFSRCTKELICANLQTLLREERKPFKTDHAGNTLLSTTYGLSAIKQFAESLEPRLLGMSPAQFQRKAVAIKNPYFFRKSTVHLPLILQKQSWVNERECEQLQGEYKTLCQQWELFGNALIKFYYKSYYSKGRGSTPAHQREVESLQELLVGLYEKEKQAASFTLELLTCPVAGT